MPGHRRKSRKRKPMKNPPNARSAIRRFADYATARYSTLWLHIAAQSPKARSFAGGSGDRAVAKISIPPGAAAFGKMAEWRTVLVRNERPPAMWSISSTTRPSLFVRQDRRSQGQQSKRRRSGDRSSLTTFQTKYRSRTPNLISSRCISQTFWTSFSAPVAELRGAS